MWETSRSKGTRVERGVKTKVENSSMVEKRVTEWRNQKEEEEEGK